MRPLDRDGLVACVTCAGLVLRDAAHVHANWHASLITTEVPEARRRTRADRDTLIRKPSAANRSLRKAAGS